MCCEHAGVLEELSQFHNHSCSSSFRCSKACSTYRAESNSTVAPTSFCFRYWPGPPSMSWGEGYGLHHQLPFHWTWTTRRCERLHTVAPSRCMNPPPTTESTHHHHHSPPTYSVAPLGTLARIRLPASRMSAVFGPPIAHHASAKYAALAAPGPGGPGERSSHHGCQASMCSQYREKITHAKLETKAPCRSIIAASPSLEAPRIACTVGELSTRDTAV